MNEPFRRHGTSIAVSLSRRERAILEQLPRALETVAPDEPAAARLDPPAYREDEEAAQEFRLLIGDDLDNARSDDRRRFAATVDSTSLTDEEAESWMRVIGDARLVLGARLGIEDEEWERDRTMSGSQEGAMLHYLGYLQDRLVAVLVDGV